MGEMEIFTSSEFDYCDNCNKPTPHKEGVMIRSNGLALLFMCDKCHKS